MPTNDEGAAAPQPAEQPFKGLHLPRLDRTHGMGRMGRHHDPYFLMAESFSPLVPVPVGVPGGCRVARRKFVPMATVNNTPGYEFA